MVKSMTGFGRGCYEEENFSVTVEIKSVNHRYNETAIRLPHFLNPLEDKIRKTILASVSRGRIDVFVTARYTDQGSFCGFYLPAGSGNAATGWLFRYTGG